MHRYCVNKNAQENGDHEVHTSECGHKPNPENQHDLGECSNCHEAVAKAKDRDSEADGCAHCSPACHTS